MYLTTLERHKEVTYMADKPKKVVVVHRKSTTGEFTTKTYAKNHPNTTERERIKRG